MVFVYRIECNSLLCRTFCNMIKPKKNIKRYHLKSYKISTHLLGIILKTWNSLTIFWFPFHYLLTNAKFPQNENVLGLKKILGLIEFVSKPKNLLLYIARNEHAFLILAFLLTQRRQGRFILIFFYLIKLNLKILC